MSKFLKRILPYTLGLLIILGGSTYTIASLGGYSWSLDMKYASDIPIRFGGLNLSTTYSQAAMTSINAWSNIEGIDIYIDGNTNNKFYVDAYAATWYGRTLRWGSGENLTQFEIEINSNRIHNDFSTNEYKAARSTFAHELGHVMGLADIYTWDNPNISLMKYARDRTVVYTPTGLDIYRVSLLYDLL